MLLLYTGLAGATLLAERLRETIGANDVPTGDDSADTKVLRVTASAGVATLTADIEDFPVLMRRADAALYRAKKEGRNRVVADARDGPPRNEAEVPSR